MSANPSLELTPTRYRLLPAAPAVELFRRCATALHASTLGSFPLRRPVTSPTLPTPTPSPVIAPTLGRNPRGGRAAGNLRNVQPRVRRGVRYALFGR